MGSDHCTSDTERGVDCVEIDIYHPPWADYPVEKLCIGPNESFTSFLEEGRYSIDVVGIRYKEPASSHDGREPEDTGIAGEIMREALGDDYDV